MAKYRKKPVVIEAEQYTEGNKKVKGLCTKDCSIEGHAKPHVHTIHKNQMVIVEIGDWIIPEPDGIHYYPCKPDIFESTYEKVKK